MPRGRLKLRIPTGTAPDPLADVPPPPENLDETGKAEWRRVAPILQKMGMLTIADTAALTLRCASFSEWAEAQAKVAELGRVVKSPAGYPVQNPYVSIGRQAMDRVLMFDRQFGLTPKARQQMRLAKPQADAELDRRKREFLAQTNRGA